MEKVIEPFEFKQCIILLKSTGRVARDVGELRDLIAAVSDESLYFHTYQFFRKGLLLEYTNDFSLWIGEALGDKVLAERLSDIDPYAFQDLDGLRGELLAVIDAHIQHVPMQRVAPQGEEFDFNEAVTITSPLGIRANNLAEFLCAVKFIDAGSLYYHFYEARRRQSGTDDFSWWFGAVYGKQDLADKIKAIDPFMHTLEGIRTHLIEAVEEAVERDMEGL